MKVRRSHRLAAALLVAHLFAAAGLLPTALPLWTKAALWAALVLSLAFALRRRPPRAITLHADGRLMLEQADGPERECRVHPATTVFPWLIALLLESSAGKVALTLPVDTLGAEAHRRLRTWLKWKASGGAA